MHRATIEIRLTRLKTLMNSVNVPEDFTISYDTDDFKHRFNTLKKNLDAMEFSISMLLDNSPGWFRYYNEWYKELRELYTKQNETSQSSAVTRRVKS